VEPISTGRERRKKKGSGEGKVKGRKGKSKWVEGFGPPNILACLPPMA